MHKNNTIDEIAIIRMPAKITILSNLSSISVLTNFLSILSIKKR